jgi:4,4'-diaponeurosporenoate glycosyltransferase
MTAALVLVLVGGLAGAAFICRPPLLPLEVDAATLGATSPHVRSVSVVIPARDEAASLPMLLASLAPPRAGLFEVLVVDDASTDATVAVAAAGGARVVPSGGPSPGWTGKTWACAVGARHAAGTTLVFLDADTWLAADGLDRILAAHADLGGDGLLSVQPFHVTREPYEQLSALANVVPVLASGMAAVRRPRRGGVAFGPCLVTSRGALDAVGGFAAVRSDTVEDIALAHRYRLLDRPVRCFAGGDVLRFRMYPDGLRSLVQGWTKNLAAGAGGAPLVPTVGAVLWVCALSAAAFAPFTAAPWGLGLYAAMAVQLRLMLRCLGDFRWWTWAAFPIALFAFVVLFLRSGALRLLRRPVRWRGREVGVDR